MLVGLSGFLAGYNGSFEFKSGEVYPEELNYVFMRVFNAIFGILCVPLVFYTARTLNYSKQATYLVTLMVVCGIPPLCACADRQKTRTRQLADLSFWIQCFCSLLRRLCSRSSSSIVIETKRSRHGGGFGVPLPESQLGR